MSTSTPNMSLVKPTPSVDTGPGWATSLNADLDLLDAHDHSSGKGAKVTPAGINVNADLPINSNHLTGVKGTTYVTGAAGFGNSQHYVDGSGELHYVDASGNDVQLTSGGHIVQPTYAGTESLSIGKLTINRALLLASTNIVTYNTATALTASGNEVVILYDVSGGGWQLTLPQISTVPGRIYVLKEKTGSTNTLTIGRSVVGDHIDGAASNKTVNTAFGATRLVADPTTGSWWII